IIYAPQPLFLGMMVILTLGMSFEWQQFFYLPQYDLPWMKTGLVFLGAVLVAKFWHLFIYMDLFFWIFATYAIVLYPKAQAKWAHSAGICFIGWLLLGVWMSILVEWQSSAEGVEFLFSVLMIVWAADIGAYLAGRKWGQHKMIPQVSPGKSWEGLWGGVSLAMLIAYLETFYIDSVSLYVWMTVSLATALISVAGDLWISVLKRHVALKDTGHLIPGHGGLLDRLDSLLAAVPVFYFGMKFLG
ncbi:MAG: phosphatidate cytidylyltransferase, partial [Pseudomonadota bacterium]|nr:phosphatidate cytidylyltransferase [Pseudomonadota bacterium]